MTVDDKLVTGVWLTAWQRLLRTQCSLLRVLDADLQAAHDITISDYDVLVSLRDSPQGRLRMSDLSSFTLLTRSGITRLIQGLERAGLVDKSICKSDARVSWISLTKSGRARLELARKTHHNGIRLLFASSFDEEEAEQLAELLGRIPGVASDDSPCSQ